MALRTTRWATPTCRLCGRSNGDATLADDAYQWPEGLAHYVEAHAVRLPVEFVAHVRRRLDRDEAVAVDRQWWCAQAPTGTERHWPEWRTMSPLLSRWGW